MREVLVVGCGRRVRDAALPALARCDGLRLRGVVARSAREVDGHAVGALGDMQDLEGVDLVYLAVGKDSVPAVLEQIVALGVEGKELLVETPVLRFKHFRHTRKLSAFRRVSVAEDCSALPWFDTLRGGVEQGLIGEPRGVLFDRSAYAYHALATAKTLLGVTRVRRGRRKRLGHERFSREIVFEGGKRADVLEPRDYSIGRITLLGSRGSISDHPSDAANDHHLEPRVEDDALVGFRVAHVETSLDEDERALAVGDPPSASVTARQEAMKRVGFLRLWRRLAAGEQGYPLAEGLDDMVVDYHLEKVGRYVANPLTSSRSPLARALLGGLSRLGGWASG